MNQKKNTKEKTDLLYDLTNFDVALCLSIVLLLFAPSLARPWLIYDERTIFEGSYFPTPSSFGEIIEIINWFGLNFNITSSNTIYSSNYITRTCPLSQLFGMLLAFFFKKEALLYHIFNLSIHIFNTVLFYLVLKAFILKDKVSCFSCTLIQRLILLLLTTIWAIHPVTVESVLLTTNFSPLITYSFFFAFLLDFLINREKNKDILRGIFIPIIYIIPLFATEHIICLPFVLFIISFYLSFLKNNMRDSLKLALIETKPYFIGLFIYACFFILFFSHRSNHLGGENSFIVFIERIFWLAPQIFVHFLKLIFYPKFLSIDQSLFVKLGKTLFDPYALFCIFILIVWLTLPLIGLVTKTRLHSLFILSFGFFFGLLPFLHILLPSYTLAAERYLYIAFAIFVLGILNLLYEFYLKKETLSRTFIIICSILLVAISLLCFSRSYLRTRDWQDNYTFINATYKTTNDPLLKAVRLGMLAKVMTVIDPQRKEEINAIFQQTLELLNTAKSYIMEQNKKYGKNLPAVIKAYGIDYNSILSKISFLQASTICLEFGGEEKNCIKLLKPYVKNLEKLDPRIAELYVHLLIQEGKYNLALKVLEKTNQIYPNTNFILIKLFEVAYNYKKDIEKAEKYLKHALKLYKYDPNILLQAINFYTKEKNELEASKYWYLYALRTGDKSAHIQALASLLNINNVRLSGILTKKLLKMAPTDPETLYFTSKYYYQSGNYKKALELLQNGLEYAKASGASDETKFDITFNLAKLYSFLGMNNELLNLEDELFNLASNNKEYLLQLAKFYNTIGLKDTVEICLQKIKRLS